jgi:exonuclease III
MIGASWNIRSLNKPCRKQALHDAISEFKFDFIGLQETKSERIDASFLDFIYPILSGLIYLQKKLLEGF